MRKLALLTFALVVSLPRAAAQNLYWESPALKALSGVSYSSSAASDDFVVLTWQERSGSGAGSTVSMYADTARLDAPGTDTRWSGKRLVHGPVPLAGVGEEGRLHAVAVDGNRILVVLVLPGTSDAQSSEIIVKSSEDGGATFHEIGRVAATTYVASPNLSRTADGGWLLLLTQPEKIKDELGQETVGKLSIAFATSRDGSVWTGLEPLVTDQTLTQNNQPYHVVLGKTDYVVFQSKRVTDHLYLKASTDGGRTWPGESIPITTGDVFAEAAGGRARTADEFSNRRPVLAAKADRLALAWERAPLGSDQYQVYYCEIDGSGTVLLPKEQVTRGGGALYPDFVTLGGQLRLLATEKQLGKARLTLATRTTAGGVALWNALSLAPSLDTAGLVPHGGILDDRLYAFAEVLTPKNEWALYAIRPDTSAPSPSLKPVDFIPGAPTNRSRVGVRWDEPVDASRIAGYQYAWSLEGRPAAPVEIVGASQQLALDAGDDGAWTLSVWSVDRAGNTSRQPATVTFRRDTTPPAVVTLLLDPAPGLDGYQPTNDFTINYVEPPGDTISRFEVTRNLPAGGGRVDYLAQGIRAENVDDGEHAVTVQAVDQAGNAGPPSTIVLRLNRYVPVTRIASVAESVDPDGNLVLRLAGRGFTAGGTVSEVILRSDDREPHDIVLRLVEHRFAVPDDRHLTGITLGSEIDSGLYRVGVRHPRRGVAWAPGAIDFSAPGTIKLGDFSFRWAPRWAAARSSRFHVPFVAMLLALAAGLLAVIFVFTTRRVALLAREGAGLQAEVHALLEGRPSPLLIEDTDRKIRALRRRGLGLRLKFSLLTSVLATVIVAVLAAPLGRQMILRERRILAEELQSRANLLLDSAAARAVSPLRVGTAGLAAIRNIPAAVNAMSGEAQYLTITGPSDPPADDPTDRDFIWASNDPAWPVASYVPGRLRIEDVDLPSEKVRRIATDLNAEATAMLRDQLDNYRSLLARSRELASKAVAAGATTADRAAAQAAQDDLLKLSDEARRKVLDLATEPGRAGSLPPFDPDRLQDEYLFYRPVADFVDDGNYLLGMVRLRVSTEKIRVDIAAATEELLRTLAVIAIVAVGLGIIGAAILAGITIRPVRVLVAGVARIRDTDAEKLKSLEGFEIQVKTKDETGMLAAAVNEMTRGLVQAAKDKEELLFGKTLQKQFIPLAVGSGGEKGSMALAMTPAVQICGYYEGAKGVSGDYFDFHPLDDRHYAIINCDVAGKGVPAAMIMVEVATLFISWCNDWTKRGTRRDGQSDAGGELNALVLLINDMLEERGFKGRFAALTVGLLDTTSGMLDVCSAGNNVLHIYDADRGALIQQPIPQTPAAGVFPSELVMMKSGFPQVRMPLDHGDAVFLFTDGFEESKRSFRAYGGDEVPCREPGLKDGEAHGKSHTCGQVSEEFGIPRITDIVNAVFSRGVYPLQRHHTVVRETIEFDFTSCTGTVEDAVLALVAVEKVFRIYRDPSTGPGQRIVVEPRVDAFLKEHFRQYAEWFTHRVEGEKPGDSIVYSHLKEDPQYDDLTLLVVRRP
jgi:hypothetical protein